MEDLKEKYLKNMEEKIQGEMLKEYDMCSPCVSSVDIKTVYLYYKDLYTHLIKKKNYYTDLLLNTIQTDLYKSREEDLKDFLKVVKGIENRLFEYHIICFKNEKDEEDFMRKN